MGALNLQDWILTDHIAGVDFDGPGFWRTATDSGGSLKCRLTWRASNFVQDRACSMIVPVRLLGVIKWRITIQLWKVGIRFLEYRNPTNFCTRMTTNCISKWKGKESITSRISSLWTCKILHFLHRQARCHGECMSSLSQQNWHHGCSTI